MTPKQERRWKRKTIIEERGRIISFLAENFPEAAAAVRQTKWSRDKHGKPTPTEGYADND